MITIKKFAALVVLFVLAGCAEKRGEAVVVEKEHIAEREQPKTTLSPVNLPAEKSSEEGASVEERELRPDEIAVDGYVMKKDVRGTGRDPRALEHEQWRVRVRLTDGGREFNVLADQSQFEKLKPGDRVNVVYHVGKYTNTIWGAELK